MDRISREQRLPVSDARAQILIARNGYHPQSAACAWRPVIRLGHRRAKGGGHGDSEARLPRNKRYALWAASRTERGKHAIMSIRAARG